MVVNRFGKIRLFGKCQFLTGFSTHPPQKKNKPVDDWSLQISKSKKNATREFVILVKNVYCVYFDTLYYSLSLNNVKALTF